MASLKVHDDTDPTGIVFKRWNPSIDIEKTMFVFHRSDGLLGIPTLLGAVAFDPRVEGERETLASYLERVAQSVRNAQHNQAA